MNEGEKDMEQEAREELNRILHSIYFQQPNTTLVTQKGNWHAPRFGYLLRDPMKRIECVKECSYKCDGIHRSFHHNSSQILNPQRTTTFVEIVVQTK